VGGIVIAAGGTGGHLYPALAVARELRALAPELPVMFTGHAERLEARVVPDAGFAFTPLASGPWRRGRLTSLATGTARTLRGAAQARRLLRQGGAQAVFSTGGFVSAPALLAAATLRLPIVLHEPNRTPGLVTRLFGRLAARVTLGDAAAAGAFPARTVRVTGIPIRGDILAGDRAAARRALGLPAGACVVLVVGGSQSAAALNRAVREALPHLAGLPVAFVWLCGRSEEPALAPVAAAAPVPVRLFGYLDDMAGALRAADLVVARAGASTIAEVTAVGLPAVLVPYPHAAADHQTANASALAAAGAGVLLPEAGLTGGSLAAVVRALATDPTRRAAMAAASLALGRPGAARAVAREILDVISEHEGKAVTGGAVHDA